MTRAATGHLRVALMNFEQHLDRQLSAQVDFATPEDCSPAAPPVALRGRVPGR